jgi:hypothetical protein
LVNPNFDGRLVLFARYRMADERRALWLLEQTNPDDDWTGRSLGQQPIFPLPPDQIGVPSWPWTARAGNCWSTRS